MLQHHVDASDASEGQAHALRVVGRLHLRADFLRLRQLSQAQRHRGAEAQPPAPTLTDGNWLLPKGQRAILTVLAQSANHQSSKSRVALLAGYSSNGGGFNNYLATLRTQGLMRSNGEMLLITETGLEALGPYEPLPTGEALHEFWLGKCGKAERAVLTELISAYPDPVTKNVLAKSTGYEPDGGGFNNALSRLRTMELIEGRGEMRAAAALFDGE
jgi:hypothetical protein